MSGSKPRQSATTTGSVAFPQPVPSPGSNPESGADPSLACPAPSGCGGKGLKYSDVRDRLKPLRDVLERQPRIALAGILEGHIVQWVFLDMVGCATEQEQIAVIDARVADVLAELKQWKPIARMANASKRIERLMKEMESGPVKRRRRRARRRV